MLQPVDAPLVQALRLDAPYRIADIGCGGGGTTLTIYDQAPAGSVVHGFDISSTLVDAARERAGRDGPRFEVSDVATAPVPERRYDRLLSRFGVVFFDDPNAAFGRLRRWLTPGGRLALAAWGPPADNPWMTLVRDIVAEFGELRAPEPDAPGPFRYAQPDRLLAILEGAGFSDLQVHQWSGTLSIGGGLGAQDAAAFALASFSSFAEVLAAAGDGALAAAQRELTRRLHAHQREGAVRLDARTHIFTGEARGATSA